ncbi:MAG: hypothetical protein K0S61_4897 [Anaerocolumna sp.]|nr:hypothetical protein [Anaerocolumna sp.]
MIRQFVVLYTIRMKKLIDIHTEVIAWKKITK